MDFETLEKLSRQLRAEDLARLVYIGDSQMVTSPNLARIAELGWQFISRLPGVYKLTNEVRTQAFAEGGWTEVGQISPGKRAASYRVQEQSGVIDGRGYRPIVVVSSSLEKRKEQALACAAADGREVAPVSWTGSRNEEAKTITGKQPGACSPALAEAIRLVDFRSTAGEGEDSVP